MRGRSGRAACRARRRRPWSGPAWGRNLYCLARMPIYEYRCENGHLFEVMQKITDDPVTTCETCGAAVSRVFHPVAVHFKGSGFYNTDYGTAKRKRETDKAASDGADKQDAKAKKETKKDATPSAGSAD